MKNNHSDFVNKLNNELNSKTGWNDESYQLTDIDIIDSKFNSIKSLVESRSTSASTLYDYCNSLNQILNINTQHGLNWLVDVE